MFKYKVDSFSQSSRCQSNGTLALISSRVQNGLTRQKAFICTNTRLSLQLVNSSFSNLVQSFSVTSDVPWDLDRQHLFNIQISKGLFMNIRPRVVCSSKDFFS